MVAGHLRQARRAVALGGGRHAGSAGTPCGDVTWLHKSHIVARRVRHGGAAERNEFVDIKLVIGEEHKVLKLFGQRAGVVAQAVQRIVHARRGEQRQGLRLPRAGLEGAVGDAVVHGREVGQVKHIAHAGAPGGVHGAFNMVVVGKGKMHRNRLGAGTHFQRHAVVVQQQFELRAVVGVEQIGAGDRGLKAPGPGHKTVAQTRALGVALARHGVGLDAYQRVTGPHMAQRVIARHKATHGIAQVGDGLLVNLLHLGQRFAGV